MVYVGGQPGDRQGNHRDRGMAEKGKSLITLNILQVWTTVYNVAGSCAVAPPLNTIMVKLNFIRGLNMTLPRKSTTAQLEKTFTMQSAKTIKQLDILFADQTLRNVLSYNIRNPLSYVITMQ